MRHLSCAYVLVRQRKLLKGNRQRNYLDRSKIFMQNGCCLVYIDLKALYDSELTHSFMLSM